MNEVINILCKRDGYTKNEAKAIIEDVMAEISVCIENGDYWEAEDIFQSELGLEIDYLLMILI